MLFKDGLKIFEIHVTYQQARKRQKRRQGDVMRKTGLKHTAGIRTTQHERDRVGTYKQRNIMRRLVQTAEKPKVRGQPPSGRLSKEQAHPEETCGTCQARSPNNSARGGADLLKPS